MIVVKFPIDPVHVQNGTYTHEGNVEDLILQGYRRSLADWLAICGKTLEEYKRLLSQGLSTRQALVYGLPYQPVPMSHDSSLYLTSVPPYTPDVLPEFDVRMNRLVSHLYLYSSLPEDLRVVWARRLLTGCYACWRKRQPWRPCIEDWYPHTKVLPIEAQENRDVSGWSHLGVYLEGSWLEGFVPTERLTHFYTGKLTRHVHYLTWYDRISRLQYARGEIVSVEAMARALTTHKYTMYRSWKNSGVELGDGKQKTFEMWCAMAKKADVGIVRLKAKRKLNRKGNMRG